MASLPPGGYDPPLQYVPCRAQKSRALQHRCQTELHSNPSPAPSSCVALGKFPTSVVLHFFIREVEARTMCSLFHRVLCYINEIIQTKHLAISSNIAISQKTVAIMKCHFQQLIDKKLNRLTVYVPLMKKAVN